jgi:Na+/H+ antiporter NhaA
VRRPLRWFRTSVALVFCVATVVVWLTAVVVAGVGAALMAAVYAVLAPLADRERIWVALERLRTLTTVIVGDLLAPCGASPAPGATDDV